MPLKTEAVVKENIQKDLTIDADVKISQTSKFNAGKFISAAASAVVIVAIGLSLFGTYTRQHSEVKKLDTTVSDLNTKIAAIYKQRNSLDTQVTKLNNSLSAAESQLSKLSNGVAVAPAPSASPQVVATAEPTSVLIVNGESQQLIVKYWPQYSGRSSDMVEEVGFTIYNNSSVTQSYSLQVENAWIKGVTPTGQIVAPFAPSGAEWLNSTIEAGGSANGYVLFSLPMNVTTLQWTYPGATQPATAPIAH